MKKLFRYSALFFFIVILSNCGPTNIVENQTFDPRTAPVIDTTHIIVRYPPEWAHSDIAAFLDTMPIKNTDQYIDKCDCGDPNLVQLTWDYDKFNSGEIQSARDNLKGKHGTAQGDDPFTFQLPKLKEDAYAITDSKDLTLAPVVESLKQTLLDTDSDGQKINIAIIDTGIDYYKNRDQEPFLYKTDNFDMGCTDQVSGWDFVYDTKNVADEEGHGTYVTRLITSELQKQGVAYRILPIKVFNSKGVGKYWDIVCALSYVKEIQRQNELNKSQKMLHIVNASFGYSFFKTQISDEELDDYKSNSIAKELIDSLSQSITFVASAGNINNDIDVDWHENFPASFTSDNLIGVGGYVTTDQGKQTDGNYGKISIDVAAPYTDYQFDFIKESVTLTGSSYSTAYISANIAVLLKSLQADNSLDVIIPPNTTKTNFYDPANNRIRIDKGLVDKISEGRYLEY